MLLLAWWTIPPYRAQIQAHERGPLSWGWQLERSPAKICDVRYFDMNQGGASIERWRLLGFETREDMPLSHARISEDSLQRATANVCRKLRKPGEPRPNVEAFARCDADGRFEIVEDRDRNVCAPRPAGQKAERR
jgi:hypothetical protein